MREPSHVAVRDASLPPTVEPGGTRGTESRPVVVDADSPYVGNGADAGAQHRLKILYHHRIGSKDGQYVHIEELVGALRAAGHDVRVVGPRGFDEQAFGNEFTFVAKLKAMVPWAVYELLELVYNFVDYRRLTRAIRDYRPDVIYERYNLPLLSGAMARRRFDIPLLLEVNAPLFAERSAYGGIRLVRLARWAEHRAWRAADHVFAVTHVLARDIAAAGVDSSRITVTPNGINHERFRPTANIDAAKRRVGLDPSTTVLGFVGFARTWHGLGAVVELLAEQRHARNLHFLLVGDGPAIKDLQQQADAAGVSARMTVTGVVGRDEVGGFVDAFDVALMSGVVAYASPLKLFEYMACGKAIVAPDQPNITEILSADHDAILFDPDSRDAFKGAVRRLVEDEALRQRLGEAARRTLTARDLSWTANVRTVTAIARGLVPEEAVNGEAGHGA